MVGFNATQPVGEGVHLVTHGEQGVLKLGREGRTPAEDFKELGRLERIATVSLHPFVTHQTMAHLVVKVSGGVELEPPGHLGGSVKNRGKGFSREHLGRVAFELLGRVVEVVGFIETYDEFGAGVDEASVAGGFDGQHKLGAAGRRRNRCGVGAEG